MYSAVVVIIVTRQRSMTRVTAGVKNIQPMFSWTTVVMIFTMQCWNPGHILDSKNLDVMGFVLDVLDVQDVFNFFYVF